MKFDIVVADPPWGDFKDTLQMSEVKRSAKDNYNGLMMAKQISELPIKDICSDNSLLALWVPSSLLSQGLEVLNAWGFTHKQTYIWVKTKNDSLIVLRNIFVKSLKSADYGMFTFSKISKTINNILSEFLLKDVLKFEMGHYFRNTHEICLIGVKGKISNKRLNRSQRSVCFAPILKHSAKPECLQDSLDLMYDNSFNKLELFARRDRNGWFCLGNQCPSTFGEDINVSLKKFFE